MPAADGRRGAGRIVEAEPAQGLQCVGIVLIAGEHQIAAGGGEFGGILEQAAIVALYPRQHLCQPRRKACVVGEATKAREVKQLFRFRRQSLRLFVEDHLQAVLDHAEKAVALAKIVGGAVGDPAAPGEQFERFQRPANPQVALAAAGDQLLGLRKELDLANAAAPQLDVVTGDGDLTEAAERMDLPLHRVDVGDRREVQVLAPDVGCEFGRAAGCRRRCRRRPAAP